MNTVPDPPAEPRAPARAWRAAAGVLALAGAAALWAFWPAAPREAPEVRRARERMVHDQIASPFVDERPPVEDERVLAALRRVPRDRFVDPAWLDEAHDDLPVPARGEASVVSQPYLVARVLEEARLRPGDRVLELGTHSGYATALLVAMGCEVVSLDGDPARQRLAAATLAGVASGAGSAPTASGRCELRDGDLALGAPDRAPFAAIIAHVAFPEVPPALAAQLAPGGRLVIPVGREGETQELVVGERGPAPDDAVTTRAIGGVRYGPYRAPAPAPPRGAGAP